jgi:cytochrome c biogenesis protein CcdA
MAADATLGLAFIAGILSFLSPCVFPLIPAYVGYLTARASGHTTYELRALKASNGAVSLQSSRLGVLLHGVFFAIGAR